MKDGEGITGQVAVWVLTHGLQSQCAVVSIRTTPATLRTYMQPSPLAQLLYTFFLTTDHLTKGPPTSVVVYTLFECVQNTSTNYRHYKGGPHVAEHVAEQASPFLPLPFRSNPFLTDLSADTSCDCRLTPKMSAVNTITGTIHRRPVADPQDTGLLK
eukprot:852378-Pyramimonas_sp.AAC.1